VARRRIEPDGATSLPGRRRLQPATLQPATLQPATLHPATWHPATWHPATPPSPARRRIATSPFVCAVCVCLLLILCLPKAAGAQAAEAARNVLYLEAFGNALYGGSINYERMLTTRLAARVGASPYGAFPVMLNYLPGRGNHSAELGAGLLVGASDENLLGTATVGYRYQPRTGGVVLRGGWTPLFGMEGIATWVGVSIGGAF
jgi:hypothetical protein